MGTEYYSTHMGDFNSIKVILKAPSLLLLKYDLGVLGGHSMKACTDIHGPQTMTRTDVGYPLTLHVVLTD